MSAILQTVRCCWNASQQSLEESVSAPLIACDPGACTPVGTAGLKIFEETFARRAGSNQHAIAMRNYTNTITAWPDDGEPDPFKIIDWIVFFAAHAEAESKPSLADSDWIKFAKLLADARKEETSNPQLSASERRRFLRNCELIKCVASANEFRNYLVLEIIETKQWRSDYPTIGDFAKSVGLSKSQVYKAADSARIKVQMAVAGLSAVAPRGREVELLAKIEVDHRVAAWCHARRVAQRDGESIRVIEFALRDYCREVGIAFGRIQENGATNTGLPVEKSLILNQIATVEVESQEVGAEADWITKLTDDEKSAFEAVLSPKAWFRAKNTAGCDRGERMAKLFLASAREHNCPHSDVQKVHMAIELAISKDASLQRAFAHLALHLVAEHLNERYSRPPEAR